METSRETEGKPTSVRARAERLLERWGWKPPGNSRETPAAPVGFQRGPIPEGSGNSPASLDLEEAERADFEERAAILEYEAGLSRKEAERQAADLQRRARGPGPLES
jgi:hypothetical protein